MSVYFDDPKKIILFFITFIAYVILTEQLCKYMVRKWVEFTQFWKTCMF